jgi:hypothetical protein
MFQMDIFDMQYLIAPVFSVLMLAILLILMVFFYTKKRVFVIILAIFLFSIILGVDSLNVDGIPFTPWFQVFFIVIQTVFFIMTAVNVYQLKYGGKQD